MADNGGGSNSIAEEALKQINDRLDRLEDEKQGIADDIKDVFSEAKALGLDVKALREARRWKKMEKHARDERRFQVDAYLGAMGLL